MKRIILVLLLSSVAFVSFTEVQPLAQVVTDTVVVDPPNGPVEDFKEGITLETFTNMVDWLYGGLIIVFGYLAYLIPGLKKVGTTWKVAAFAGVVGIGLVMYGSSSLTVVFTYLMSTGFYSHILKLFKKSPKEGGIEALFSVDSSE